MTYSGRTAFVSVHYLPCFDVEPVCARCYCSTDSPNQVKDGFGCAWLSVSVSQTGRQAGRQTGQFWHPLSFDWVTAFSMSVLCPDRHQSYTRICLVMFRIRTCPSFMLLQLSVIGRGNMLLPGYETLPGACRSIDYLRWSVTVLTGRPTGSQHPIATETMETAPVFSLPCSRDLVRDVMSSKWLIQSLSSPPHKLMCSQPPG